MRSAGSLSRKVELYTIAFEDWTNDDVYDWLYGLLCKVTDTQQQQELKVAEFLQAVGAEEALSVSKHLTGISESAFTSAMASARQEALQAQAQAGLLALADHDDFARWYRAIQKKANLNPLPRRGLRATEMFLITRFGSRVVYFLSAVLALVGLLLAATGSFLARKPPFPSLGYLVATMGWVCCSAGCAMAGFITLVKPIEEIVGD